VEKPQRNRSAPTFKAGTVNSSEKPPGSTQLNLVSVSVARHSESTGHVIVFGSLNVWSLSRAKLDALLIELRDRRIDVMCLRETCHDSDSVSIRRLRASGYVVVERARPRSHAALRPSLGVNHRGVAIVSSVGVRLSAIDLGVST
jgi:hypothetical protein